jgi:hypothetical protein
MVILSGMYNNLLISAYFIGYLVSLFTSDERKKSSYCQSPIPIPMDLGDFFLRLAGISAANDTTKAVQKQSSVQKKILAVLEASQAQTDAVINLTKIMAILAGITLLCGFIQITLVVLGLLKGIWW